METITEVRIMTVNRTVEGVETPVERLIIYTDKRPASGQKGIWLSPSQLKARKAPVTAELLVGCSIKPTFYKEGDEMFGGNKCTADDSILKDFNFEVTQEYKALRKAHAIELEFGANAAKASYMAAAGLNVVAF